MGAHTSMEPRDYQLEGAEQGYAILKQYGIVYFAWEERTGKSLTAVTIAEKCRNLDRVLIITKKKAKPDWLTLLSSSTVNNAELSKVYFVTTYTSIEHLHTANWDLIILDESHNYVAGYPNASKTWKQVRKFTRNKPIIYLSATPNAQTYAQLYPQLALSDWSPFSKYKNYKVWHAHYGIEYFQYLYKKRIQMWDRVKDDLVIAKTKHLFLTKTRVELDFPHEPEDVIHWIELGDQTRAVYNWVVKKKTYQLSEDLLIEYDTKAKLRAGLHMLEGGSLKHSYPILNSKGKPVMTADHYMLSNTEKIDYIKETWGDNENVAVMYHYISEGIKLRNHFKHAHILQGTTHAEGIDLHHIKHLVIYSQDWSTSRHTQRRARQANMLRDSEIKVHFLLVRKGISEEVYNTVSVNKTNYVDRYFQGSTI